jgi:predicted esterase
MDRSPPAPTRRGTHEITLSVPWRLDGPDGDPGLPLVVCLHGQGMDEDRFALLLRGLGESGLRLLLPRAPYPLEVRRERRVGASWYAYDGDPERFRAELLRTEARLLDLLHDVEAQEGLRPRTRALLGFSQGGYLAGFVALRHPDRFRAMVVMGARVKAELLEAELPGAAAAGFGALLLHGRRDAAVAPEAAERSRDALVRAGVDVELRTFDRTHVIGREMVADAAVWLAARLG